MAQKKKFKMRKPTIKSASDAADKWFSLYIRLRDSNFRGVVKCITCTVSDYFKGPNMNCGHFQSRSHKATRWHIHNANGQCVGCNKWKSGDQYRHGRMIDLKFGRGSADEMELLARTTIKRTVQEVVEIAEHFRNLAKIEASKRGIEL